MDEKTCIHLEDNTHYYLFNDKHHESIHRTRFNSGRNIIHADGEVVHLKGAWFSSEKNLDVSKFQEVITRRNKTGYKRLPEHIPEYVHLDAIPETLTVEEYESGDYNQDFYTAEYETYKEVVPIEAEWTHAVGCPAPEVKFAWRALFPHVLDKLPELYHLFPCKIIWSQSYGGSSESYLKSVLEPLKQKYNIRSLFVQSGKVSVFFNRAETIEEAYPSFQADNLFELKEKFDTWLKNIVERIERNALYDQKGYYKGVFVGAFDRDEIEKRFRDVKRSVVHAAKQSNKDGVASAMAVLESFIWKQIAAAAAWESGVEPPEKDDSEVAS